MLYRPLNLFVTYILITLCISFFGPLVYHRYDKGLVALYMFAFLLLFSIGYFLGAGRKPRGLTEPSAARRREETLNVVRICIVVAVVVKLAEFVLEISTNGINLSLSGMGGAYLAQYEGYVRNVNRPYSVLEIVRLLTFLPYQVTIILGSYYYRELRKAHRWSVVAVILMTVIVVTIGQGRQKQLGDIVIFLLCVYALHYAKGPIETRRKMLRRILALGLLAFAALVVLQKQRYDALGIYAWNYDYKAPWMSSLDLDNPVFRLFGYEWGFPIANLLSVYFGGGYYGLSLCLALPFKWTYFIGNSYSVMVACNRFLGLPFLLNDTYILRMEQTTGWPGMSRWHTVFPWFASDLTFAGTLLMFALVAYVYAVSWKEACHGNPISITMFSVLTLGLIFVPGNNQLLHSVEGVISTWVLFVIWILKHKAYNLDVRPHPPAITPPEA